MQGRESPFVPVWVKGPVPTGVMWLWLLPPVFLCIHAVTESCPFSVYITSGLVMLVVPLEARTTE